jgi:hypothetical protein
MAELIQQYNALFQDKNGDTYSVVVRGARDASGTWEGWLEFHPIDKTKAAWSTGRETTQPEKSALEYWASGLEPLYFEGAFERAKANH